MDPAIILLVAAGVVTVVAVVFLIACCWMHLRDKEASCFLFIAAVAAVAAAIGLSVLASREAANRIESEKASQTP